jgi:ABC-type dipeptide/oligopeptide/nickel transport system permease subunit
MMIDAGFVRYENPESWNWVIYGTVALCVFMAGTSFFGEAIYAKLDYKKEMEIIKKGD